MSRSWFEDRQQQELEQELTASRQREQEEAEKAERDSAEEQAKAKKSETGRSTRSGRKAPALKRPSTLALGATAAGVVLVAVIGVSINQITGGVADEVAAPAAEVVESSMEVAPPTVETTTPAPTTEVAVSKENCPEQPEATTETPEGAVVAFQQSYFAGDVEGLEKAVDPESYLNPQSLAEAAGELVGASACVQVEAVNGDVVEADTTVTTDNGDEYLLMQNITTAEVDGEYRLTEIADRPENSA